MKQVIMEKLFAEKPLTNEEILHIGSCLEDGENIKLAPYNHTVGNLADACGISNETFESINTLIQSEVMDKKKKLDLESKQVEVYEKLARMKPEYLRILMYQFVKMKTTLRKGQMVGGGGMNIGGNDHGGDIEGFLNFLKGLGR